MCALGGGGCSSGEDARNDHQSTGSNALCVSSVCGGGRGILGSGSDNHRNSGFHKPPNALLALLIGQQGPVAHRTAVDDAVHAGGNQLLCLVDKGLLIG